MIGSSLTSHIHEIHLQSATSKSEADLESMDLVMFAHFERKEYNLRVSPLFRCHFPIFTRFCLTHSLSLLGLPMHLYTSILCAHIQYARRELERPLIHNTVHDHRLLCWSMRGCAPMSLSDYSHGSSLPPTLNCPHYAQGQILQPELASYRRANILTELVIFA
jgi:hypothetical protein